MDHPKGRNLKPYLEYLRQDEKAQKALAAPTIERQAILNELETNRQALSAMKKDLSAALKEIDVKNFEIDSLNALMKETDFLREAKNFAAIQRTLRIGIQKQLDARTESSELRDEFSCPNEASSAQEDSSAHESLGREALKRKMDVNLYLPNKKMRLSPFYDLGSLSKQHAAQYVKMVNTEILRVAGRSGLLNPLVFDVNKAGIISFTELGLRKVNSIYKFKTYAEVAAYWRKEKGVELSAQLREIMDKYNFWDQGHRTTKCFRDGLIRRENMTPGDIYESLTEVMIGAKNDLANLDATLARLKATKSLPTAELMEHLQLFATELYADYKTRRLNGRAKVAWSEMFDHIQTPEAIYKFFKNISDGYHELIRFRATVLEAGKIPNHLVLQEDTDNPDNLFGILPLSRELRRQIYLDDAAAEAAEDADA
ncbi:hypothetical protein ACLX1H_006688 [Fusarium chlamydosporum]